MPPTPSTQGTHPTEPPRVLLRVESVNLNFDGYAVLQDVSLSLTEREVVTIVGLNGSGKTTLLRVILGLQAPDSGSIWRADEVRIGYMPQRLTIEDSLPLTVYRFLRLAAVQPLDRKIALRLLEEVGAPEVIDAPIQRVSGGELQRVLLARTLARDPNLLILDEPVQSVDMAGQFDLYDLIGQVRDRRGCSILMVSHDLHLVMPQTDQVLCMNHHICCSGPPDLVSQHPAYRELFGIDRQHPMAVYRHHHDHRHDAHGDIVDST